MAAILTLDLGSTQLKLMVLSENAEVLYLDSEKYPTYAEDGGFLEQKPEEWIEALQRGMRKLGQRMDARSIDAVSFSGHMSGVVLVDKQGEVLRPCVMLSDSRSQQECVELSETVGELVRRYTGNPVINAFSLPKLLWIKRHEPAALATNRRMAGAEGLSALFGHRGESDRSTRMRTIRCA